MGSTYFNKRIPRREAAPRRARARPKSFATREKAEAYAKEQGIAKFEIEQLSIRKFYVKNV